MIRPPSNTECPKSAKTQRRDRRKYLNVNLSFRGGEREVIDSAGAGEKIGSIGTGPVGEVGVRKRGGGVGGGGVMKYHATAEMRKQNGVRIME